MEANAELSRKLQRQRERMGEPSSPVRGPAQLRADREKKMLLADIKPAPTSRGAQGWAKRSPRTVDAENVGGNAELLRKLQRQRERMGESGSPLKACRQPLAEIDSNKAGRGGASEAAFASCLKAAVDTDAHAIAESKNAPGELVMQRREALQEGLKPCFAEKDEVFFSDIAKLFREAVVAGGVPQPECTNIEVEYRPAVVEDGEIGLAGDAIACVASPLNLASPDADQGFAYETSPEEESILVEELLTVVGSFSEFSSPSPTKTDHLSLALPESAVNISVTACSPLTRSSSSQNQLLMTPERSKERPSSSETDTTSSDELPCRSLTQDALRSLSRSSLLLPPLRGPSSPERRMSRTASKYSLGSDPLSPENMEIQRVLPSDTEKEESFAKEDTNYEPFEYCMLEYMTDLPEGLVEKLKESLDMHQSAVDRLRTKNQFLRRKALSTVNHQTRGLSPDALVARSLSFCTAAVAGSAADRARELRAQAAASIAAAREERMSRERLRAEQAARDHLQLTCQKACAAVSTAARSSERREESCKRRWEVEQLEGLRVKHELQSTSRDLALSDDQILELQRSMALANGRRRAHCEARKALQTEIEKLRKESSAHRARQQKQQASAERMAQLRKELNSANAELLATT